MLENEMNQKASNEIENEYVEMNKHVSEEIV